MRSIHLKERELQALLEKINRSCFKKIPVRNKYELMRVKIDSTTLIIYRSGKVVYHDVPLIRDLLLSILEYPRSYDYFLGSDEAGKGEWYGPLVVAGVALTPHQVIDLRLRGIRDSKTLSKHKVIELGSLLRRSFPTEVITLRPETYNRLYREFRSENKTLNDLMAWAHSSVLSNLLKRLHFTRAQIIIDQFDIKATDLRLGKVKQFNVDIIQKKGGESEIPVAAASIIAKLIFEENVDELNKKYAIDLRNIFPAEIPIDILSKVAKMHFKNVSTRND